MIREEADGAIDRSFNILRTRIDKFGVTQPNIQKIGSGRILIELPGVKEPERVRKLLQGTAKLEFWETFDNREVFNYLVEINKYLKDANIAPKDTAANAAADSDTSKTKLADAEKDTTKKSLVEKLSGSDSSQTASNDTSKQSLEKFTKDNPLFAVMSPAIVQNEKGQQEYRRGPVVGYVAIKDTAKVNRILAMPGVRSILPKELRLLWTVKPMVKESNALELIAVKTRSRDGRAPLEGDAIVDARMDFGQINHAPEISMTMNAEGARVWKRLTGENIGKSIAIVLDDYIYSYPNVQGEISGGSSSITGRFEIDEAKDLANILKAGKLPAPARIVEEAVVGPSLGKEAINAGLAFICYSACCWCWFSWCSTTAMQAGWLILRCSPTYSYHGSSGFTGCRAYLPGIAGMVLTIGMSVDANILIFERVREEFARKRNPPCNHRRIQTCILIHHRL